MILYHNMHSLSLPLCILPIIHCMESMYLLSYHVCISLDLSLAHFFGSSLLCLYGFEWLLTLVLISFHALIEPVCLCITLLHGYINMVGIFSFLVIDLVLHLSLYHLITIVHWVSIFHSMLFSIIFLYIIVHLPFHQSLTFYVLILISSICGHVELHSLMGDW